MSSHYSQTSYRPDIDGLRGVAILSVILFHAFPSIFPGGYIGVDIFFVISGYLISSIILQNLEQKTFSFRVFYARRIRRIFPALLLVLMSCGVFGWFALMEDEFVQLGNHMIGGALFWSNFLLKAEAGYFDSLAETKLLLHLWSLAIEEQFYIVFPILLVTVYRIRRSWIPVVILLAIAYSFGKNILITQKSVETAFFLPKTRVWELLIGVALAYQTVFRQSWLRGLLNRIHVPVNWLDLPQSRELIAVTGVMLLIAAWVLLDKDSLFPGWWAVLPTLGAGLLIAAGSHTWIGRVILANPICIWVGLISFSLYLWHWPLLSFAYIIHGGLPPPEVRISLLVLSFIMAASTTYWVERPIRFGRDHAAKVGGLVSAMSVAGLMGWAIKGELVHPRIYSDDIHRIVKAKDDWEYPPKHALPVEFENHKFHLIQGARRETTLFMVDSNIEQYGQRIGRVIEENPVQTTSAIFATTGGCPPIPYVFDMRHSYCPGLLQAALHYAKRPEVERVVIGAAWFSYFSWADGRYLYKKGQYSEEINSKSDGQDRALGELSAMIGELKRSGKKVYLVLNIPNGSGIAPQSMIVRDVWSGRFSIHNEGVDKASILQTYGSILQKLKTVALKSGATVIDPMEFLCNDNTCPSISIAGDPMYKDAGHLRTSYVRDHVTFIDQTVMLTSALGY